jgi:6-phosphogluconolactonase (cycloisomerase 2 family)
VLTPVPGSPFAADRGVSALAGTDSFLYTANTLANNVSGFQINADGSLKTLQDSPYTSPGGTGPSAIAIDPAKNIVYVTMPGSSFSIWAFTIDQTTGKLTAVHGSPFNLLSGGGLFLVMEPRGNYFYVANQTTTNIAGYKYNSGTGSGTPAAITDSPFTTGTPGEMVIVP